MTDTTPTLRLAGYMWEGPRDPHGVEYVRPITAVMVDTNEVTSQHPLRRFPAIPLPNTRWAWDEPATRDHRMALIGLPDPLLRRVTVWKTRRLQVVVSIIWASWQEDVTCLQNHLTVTTPGRSVTDVELGRVRTEFGLSDATEDLPTGRARALSVPLHILPV